MQVVRVKGEIGSDGYLRLELPTQLPAGPIELVLVLGSVPPRDGRRNYDFKDLSGKLSWRGDAVAVQRSLRDEW